MLKKIKNAVANLGFWSINLHLSFLPSRARMSVNSFFCTSIQSFFSILAGLYCSAVTQSSFSEPNNIFILQPNNGSKMAATCIDRLQSFPPKPHSSSLEPVWHSVTQCDSVTQYVTDTLSAKAMIVNNVGTSSRASIPPTGWTAVYKMCPGLYSRPNPASFVLMNCFMFKNQWKFCWGLDPQTNKLCRQFRTYFKSPYLLKKLLDSSDFSLSLNKPFYRLSVFCWL